MFSCLTRKGLIVRSIPIISIKLEYILYCKDKLISTQILTWYMIPRKELVWFVFWFKKWFKDSRNKNAAQIRIIIPCKWYQLMRIFRKCVQNHKLFHHCWFVGFTLKMIPPTAEAQIDAGGITFIIMSHKFL